MPAECGGRRSHRSGFGGVRRPFGPSVGVAVEFAHEFAVHGPGGGEGLGELLEFGLELGDLPLLPVVVGFEFGGALFELIEQWDNSFASCGVGGGTELPAEPLL